MLPLHSRILVEGISIASTSLQEGQSISLALLLQRLHLHQSTFPILILYVINQQLKCEYERIFSIRKNGRVKTILSHVFPSG